MTVGERSVSGGRADLCVCLMIYIVWPDIWPCRWITIHQFGTVQLSLDGHQIRPRELGIKRPPQNGGISVAAE